jgi:hypothetical protein
MRIPVTLIIDMTDAQVQDYAEVQGIPLANGGKPYAKDIVEDVRRYVLTAVQDSPAFGQTGLGARAATVTIKQ